MFLVFEVPGVSWQIVFVFRISETPETSSKKPPCVANEQRRAVQDADGHAGKPKQTFFFTVVALPSFN
eukprot:COSAG06_NODE_530_length_14570_cov_23.269435_11_plen_68_part_00